MSIDSSSDDIKEEKCASDASDNSVSTIRIIGSSCTRCYPLSYEIRSSSVVEEKEKEEEF